MSAQQWLSNLKDHLEKREGKNIYNLETEITRTIEDFNRSNLLSIKTKLDNLMLYKYLVLQENDNIEKFINYKYQELFKLYHEYNDLNEQSLITSDDLKGEIKKKLNSLKNKYNKQLNLKSVIQNIYIVYGDSEKSKNKKIKINTNTGLLIPISSYRNLYC